MHFVLLSVAIGMAAGIAGIRVTFSANQRVRVMQRLHEGQAAAGRQRIVDLEYSIYEIEARLARCQIVEAAERRTHSAILTAVSREIRTPLDTLLGFADLMQVNAVNEPLRHRQAQAVDQIRQAAVRIQSLVEGLTTFAGASDPRVRAHEALDPLLIARRIIDAMMDKAKVAKVSLTPIPHQAGLTVQADAPALEQILSALIGNAIQHNRPGGSVSVEARRMASEVWIAVRDTGPGVSEAGVEALFDPFTRRQNPSSSIGGAGVGLAAARRLADSMGGTLSAESRKGEGTTVILRMPAARQAEIPLAAKAGLQAALALPRLPNSALLFIADDQGAVALMRRLMLELGSIHLHVAANAHEGLELARDLKPDAIILDLEVGGGQGLAVKSALAADALTRDVPVMALSATIAHKELRRIRGAGFDELLTRPVIISDLAAGLSRILTVSADAAYKGRDRAIA